MKSDPKILRRFKPILIVLAGKTFSSISQSEGDFDDWIARGLNDTVASMRVDATTANSFPHPSELAGVVVSGSHAMVSNRECWSERLALWLRQCVDEGLPILGICFGHQLLAHAFGGKVDFRPAGIEIGTHEVTVSTNAADDLLFGQMPNEFLAQLVHSQSVLQLPEGATLLAFSQLESHHAFRIGRCAWGVQFHPEFSPQTMRTYLQEVLGVESRGLQELLESVKPTQEAATLLPKFAMLCREGGGLGNHRTTRATACSGS